ncbi:MAG TPA: hypothetical protein VMT03_14000 [Polyangia bacterium]|nr:hypothetical protein [Polyangia bacterium]
MSIFSRLKKPAAGEASRPAAEPPARGERSSHPTADSSETAAQAPAPPPPFPPAPPAKPNGVHPAAATPATPPIPAPPNGAWKRPELSTTMAYGAVRPPVLPPPVAVPTTITEPDSGSVDLAIEKALGAEPAAKVAHGASTASDQAALRATFEDLAVPYVAEIRGAMMELQWGEAQASWLEMARPVLRSLRKMAEPVGHTALVEALDRFDAALADVLAPGQPATPSAAARDALLAAYAPLRACLPRAFELQGERDRREPLIVRALLEQVPGLDPLSIEKLTAAGFGKLSALYAGRAEEIAAVSGIADEVAAALVARVQAFRQATPAGLAAVDTGATLRELARLVADLRTQHGAFEGASRNWSEQGRIGKRHLRRERQVSLLQITIELVRLGEVDLVQRLEKLPFNKKIDEVEELIGRTAQSAKAKKREEGRTWVS